ncbi:DUF6904 family protein [Bacillus sp. 1P02SD]|uniref:DUF6904 family protein n=1 Tax=Bacillus sp. 1P02SD TaxID=3132264 RepID=UPI0039A2A434
MDALHAIVGEDGEYLIYKSARLRAMELCYDIRHSLLGDREFNLKDNGITTEMMKYHSLISRSRKKGQGQDQDKDKQDHQHRNSKRIRRIPLNHTRKRL